MFIRRLIDQGADEEYLEHIFQVERYAWLTLTYDMAAVIDLGGRFLDVNSRWERVTGFPIEELQDRYLLEFMRVEERESTLAEFQKLITADMVSASFPFSFQKKNGDFLRLNWNVFYSPGHEAFFCVVKDVSEKGRDLAYAAYHDVLTGLGNRLYLADSLPDILKDATASRERVGLMFLDLDGFKQINDTFGHKAGDEVLKRSARAIDASLLKPGFAARFGGDEFVAVLTDNPDRRRMQETALRILRALEGNICPECHPLKISASIGVAMFPEVADPEGLIEAADEAMYDVKRGGKGDYAFYEPESESKDKTFSGGRPD